MGGIVRSDTSDAETIVRNAGTTLTFGASPAIGDLPPFDVMFHFAEGATYDTSLHFHVDKTEYLYVERGAIRLTLNGVTRMVTSTHGQMEVPKWAPHRWEVLGGEETIAWERTVPSDGQKEAFFRNFMSLINDYGGLPPFLQVYKIFADYDNYPIADFTGMGYLKMPIVMVTKVLGWVGRLAGYRSVYKEYTPRELYTRLG